MVHLLPIRRIRSSESRLKATPSPAQPPQARLAVNLSVTQLKNGTDRGSYYGYHVILAFGDRVFLEAPVIGLGSHGGNGHGPEVYFIGIGISDV